MKRRWFQIHLSTAMVLMLCAGGLLWLNVRTNGWLRGWPCTWGYRLMYLDSEEAAIAWKAGHELSSEWQTNTYYLTVNVAVAVAFLIVIAALLEFLLRRREARIQ